MPASKAQQKAVTKYMKANYDEIKVRVEKGQKDNIQAHAVAHGESVNGFIGRAISETMERDGGGMASEIAQRAADAAGEAVLDFIRRAVETQAKRDKASITPGINPVAPTSQRMEE